MKWAQKNGDELLMYINSSIKNVLKVSVTPGKLEPKKGDKPANNNE